jgi:hypothetical protein
MSRARGSGARKAALFMGRTRGRLSLKEPGELAGGIHHNAVSIAIRRFTQRLKSDHALLGRVSLIQKALETHYAPGTIQIPAMSNRSRFMTLFQAATKSLKNFFSPSELA